MFFFCYRYVKMFKFFKETAEELCGFEVQPDVILIDFEKGAHNAAAEVLKCKTKGCKFHYSQSLLKHIQKLPLLRTTYTTPTEQDKNGRFVPNEGRDWLVSFLGLCHLPPEVVGDVFAMLCEIMPDGEEFSTFSDYVLETYIDESQAM